MSLPEHSLYVRVLPRATTLDIILKNTHFPDDILNASSPIQFHVAWKEGIPVLVFQFKSASYDFSEPLVPAELKSSENDWMQKRPVVVRLLLSDNVITDQVTERQFTMNQHDSNRIRHVFHA